jgi:hypothetical protein
MLIRYPDPVFKNSHQKIKTGNAANITRKKLRINLMAFFAEKPQHHNH